VREDADPELQLTGKEHCSPGAVSRHEAESRDRLRLIHEPKALIFDEPTGSIRSASAT
jgi:ABC-type ATPase involved in cell division